MATAGLADIHNNSCWGRTVMRKKNKKDAGNIFGFSQSFSNTQEESEKINLTWIIQ